MGDGERTELAAVLVFVNVQPRAEADRITEAEVIFFC